MAKAKKLPSGMWRTLVYDYTDENGKRHYESFTAETKRESEYMAAEFALGKKKTSSHSKKLTVDEAVKNYLDIKRDILSPTTLRGYQSISNNLMKDIGYIAVRDLNSANIQAWIGKLSISHKPKTVKNVYGLFSAVIDTYYPELHFKIKLPQKEKINTYVPTDNDIKALIEYFYNKDKDMLIASYLAAFGTLRRSEICALTSEDIIGNTVKINKAMVLGNNKEWIIKSTKNTSSTRDVVLPQFVIDTFPKKGPLVNINPSRVSDRFIKALKRLNIHHFRFHDLRHYSASIMHAIGIPDVYIMQRGGWSSDGTLKNIYRGSIEDFEHKFTQITNTHFEAMQHEMQHKKINPN